MNIRRVLTVVGLGGSHPTRSLKKALRALRERVVHQHVMDDADLVYEATDVIEAQRRELAEANARVHNELAEQAAGLGELAGIGPECSELALVERMKEMRRAYDTLGMIKDVMGDRFDADAGLLRRLGCSMGLPSWDADSVVKRGAALANALRENKALQQRVRELEDELDSDGEPW